MYNQIEISIPAHFNAELFDMFSAEEADFLKRDTATANLPIPTDGIGLILAYRSHLTALRKLFSLLIIDIVNLMKLPYRVLKARRPMIAIGNGIHKIVFSILTVIVFNTACFAAPSEVAVYENQLNSIAPMLTNHNYQSNYFFDSQKDKEIRDACYPASHCQGVNLSTILEVIQNNKLHYISPVMVPDSANDLLSDIKKLTKCKDLGFMNVKQLSYEQFSDQPQTSSVPWRPTSGFVIYKLPISGQSTLLVRGSQYNLAWSFWGADLSGIKLPPPPSNIHLFGNDFLTEIKSTNCQVVQQFNLESLSNFKQKNYSHVSFSEPVVIDGGVYILQIVAEKSFANQPVYDLNLTKLDTKTGRSSWNFFYSTFFEEKSK